jgi:hypothetical protein
MNVDSTIGNGSHSHRPSSLFLDLREIASGGVAVRVRPEHAAEVWQLLRLRDTSIGPLPQQTFRTTVYLTKPDGTPYLDGDCQFVEIRTRGSLHTVTKQLASFFIAAAERTLRGE